MRAHFLIGLGLFCRVASLGGAAYLGVSVGRTPAPQREALGLAQDAGLTLRAVATNSAAAAAGLQADDILTRLDEQWLYSGEQLAALLRSRAPGDRATLDRVRQGASDRIEVSLGEVPPDVSPPPVVRVAIVPFSRWNDPVQQKRLPEAILQPENSQSRGPSPDLVVEPMTAAAPPLTPPLVLARDDLLATVDAEAEILVILAKAGPDDATLASPAAALSPPGATIASGESPVPALAIAADDVTILIETTDGRRDATFLRHDGAILFRGPVDTEEDRMRLPPALRQRALEVFDPVDWTPRSTALPEAIEFRRLDARFSFL